MPLLLVFFPFLIRIGAYLCDFLPRKLVLLPEQAVYLCFYLCISEIIISRRKIPHQFVGVMPDLPDVITVLIIVRVIFLCPVNLYLQVRFQFRVPQLALVDLRIIRHITGGNNCGLYAGEHGRTGRKQGAEHGNDQYADPNRSQNSFMRRHGLCQRPYHLPGSIQHVCSVLYFL